MNPDTNANIYIDLLKIVSTSSCFNETILSGNISKLYCKNKIVLV